MMQHAKPKPGETGESPKTKIEEGIVKKGGVNSSPSTDRPGPPKGQTMTIGE